MKITSLEIKNYKQFSDLKLNLTYPKGHDKEGQPLDKVCIIGQSGTGKTNLLYLIQSIESNYFGWNKQFSTNNSKIILKYQTQNKNFIELDFIKENENIENKKLLHEECYFTETSEKENNNIWKELKYKIDNHNNVRLEYVDKLSNKILNLNNYDKKDYKRDMKKWEDENENILEKIANNLNDILLNFNVELIKIDKNQSTYNNLTFKDLSNKKIIKYDFLSTGMKNFISTFIPLRIQNPKDSIILIDEPENSFYPDIQRKLVNQYMNVGENNQLIMATHSPLIASSFEPWEVVELKFDENNQIYRELYYEGENHIDNYTLDPRMLTWTSILVDIFDLKEDSFSLREKKLMEYGMLKSEIKAMEKGEDRDEKIKIFKKLSALLGLQN